tara:strand:+ start:98 stop:598 length:501 start_codon:yes stop_codon:yes gene_type:complete
MKIIDNALDQNYFNELVDKFTHPNFPYFLNTVNRGGDEIQFVHALYFDNQPQSDAYEWIEPLLDKLNVCSLVRCKLNMMPRTDTIKENEFHVDIETAPKNLKTALLYLNTNNGYTMLKESDEIENVNSVANRILMFDGHIQHTGTTNTCKEKYRHVLNIDYFEAIS